MWLVKQGKIGTHTLQLSYGVRPCFWALMFPTMAVKSSPFHSSSLSVNSNLMGPVRQGTNLESEVA